MSGIRAGRLKDRVTIKGEPAQDSYGHRTGAEAIIAIRPCAIEPLNGREYHAANGEHGEQKVNVRFRFEPNLLKRGRSLFDNRTSPQTIYDIEDVINPRNENRELICKCVVRQ